MCLTDDFKRRFELMAPDERITLSRKDLEFLLERSGPCGCTVEATPRPREPARKNTAWLAEHYGRSESTVRGWISQGWFGTPDKLKPNGRDYEIPSVAVQRVDCMLDEGKRFVGGRWQSFANGATDGAVAPGLASPAQTHGTGLSANAETQSSVPAGAPKTRKVRTRSRNTAGKYGGWRDALEAGSA